MSSPNPKESEAMRKARRLPMPRHRNEYVHAKSIEIALAFMKIHNVKKVRFMGDVLVIEELGMQTPPQTGTPNIEV